MANWLRHRTTAEAPSLLHAKRRPTTLREILPSTGIALHTLRFRDTNTHETEVFAPAPGLEVHLTLDPHLQRTALTLLPYTKAREAAVVMADTQTGEMLVYASYVGQGKARDVCAEAHGPAASLFKIVTAAALVEAGVSPSTKQCYFGGSHRLEARHLLDNPKRDRSCTTLAGALGESINTVFARLALKHLNPKDLESMAKRFGFGASPPFEFSVAPSRFSLPKEPHTDSSSLDFARIAAGFGQHTTLSPVGALTLSGLVARKGVPLPLSIVRKVVSTHDHKLLYAAGAKAPPPQELGPSLVSLPQLSQDKTALSILRPEPKVAHGQLAPQTASAVREMMERTVLDGTSSQTFSQGGKSWLGNVSVAGKTGTLTDAETGLLYTWFSGFAPSKAPQVVLAALVVEGHIKANVLARDMFRAYLEEHHVPGVTAPTIKEFLAQGHARLTRKRAENPSHRKSTKNRRAP